MSVYALALRAADAPDPGLAPENDWKLIWSDEFDGASIDAKKWAFDRGTGFYAPDKQWVAQWGNNELQFYTERPENVFVKDGQLHLRALKESYKGSQYTSARLKTRANDRTELFAKLYGRIEFRAKLPLGQGLWPAVWMLPQDEKYGGWAASGEIDILEAKGQIKNTVQGTLHYGSKWPANTYAKNEYVLPDNGSIADFHVYALEWEPGEMRWFVDGKLYGTQKFWWSSSDQDGPRGVAPVKESELNPWPAPFDQKFYLIINLAVGGQFLGNPDKTTPFPAEMRVDYVRVYDKVGGYGPVKARGEGKLPFEKK